MNAEPPNRPTPFELLGGADRVRTIAERFYEIMARDEPALARLHPCDADGRVEPDNRERFASFLVGWLGGPPDYVAHHGHPRLRMRHARVAVNVAMRDAWLRCMRAAFDACSVDGAVREFLDARLADLADFLRNVPG